MESKRFNKDLLGSSSNLGNNDLANVCVHGTAVIDNNPQFASFNSNTRSKDCFSNSGKKNPRGIAGSPPGGNFFLNRLGFMNSSASSDDNVISLPELLYPVESISQIFIATFTSDILWYGNQFLSIVSRE